MAAIATKPITAEEFTEMEKEMDKSMKYELVRGEVVEMCRPKSIHGYVQTEVAGILRDYVKPRKLGWVMVETGVIVERDPDTLRGPVVRFYTIARHPERPTDNFEMPPDIAVEVRSSDDRASKIREKVREYVAAGVRLVWIVNPEDKTVMVYSGTMRGTELDETDILEGGDVLPGFTCKVADFFA